MPAFFPASEGGLTPFQLPVFLEVPICLPLAPPAPPIYNLGETLEFYGRGLPLQIGGTVKTACYGDSSSSYYYKRRPKMPLRGLGLRSEAKGRGGMAFGT